MSEHAALTFDVTDADTARALGSGDVPVLATPRLIAWVEAATCAALALEDGQTSVGTNVDFAHQRPSAVGETVTVTATLTGVDGRTARLMVAATNADGNVVGTGEITRAIVDRERFLARLRAG